MKISQIILKGVNNFKDFSYSFQDEWSKSVPESILLMGPNGSGKTTLLRAIRTLWEVLAGFLEVPNQTAYTVHNGLFDHCKFVAMAIRDFTPELSQPVWIYLGYQQEVDQFLLSYPQDYKVGGVWKMEEAKKSGLYEPYGALADFFTQVYFPDI